MRRSRPARRLILPQWAGDHLRTKRRPTALPYREITPATGRKGLPKGVMLYMHGGAWTATGKAFVGGPRKPTRRSPAYAGGCARQPTPARRTRVVPRHRACLSTDPATPHPNAKIAVGGELSRGRLALEARLAPPRHKTSGRRGDPRRITRVDAGRVGARSFSGRLRRLWPRPPPGRARVLASRVAAGPNRRPEPIAGPGSLIAPGPTYWSRPGRHPWTHGGVSQAAWSATSASNVAAELTDPHRLNGWATQRDATW